MSDQQPNNPSPDEPEIKGGWNKPESTGGWRPIAEAQKEAEDEETGWRVVPAMPRELDVQPTDEGIWHLPQPDDTTFKPGDEIEIAPRPENVVFPQPGESFYPAASIVDDDDDDDLESFSGLGELVALVSLVERQPQPSIVLKGETTEEPESSDAGDAIEAALVAAQKRAEADAEVAEEDEDLDFSDLSAEREALSQITGRTDVPRVPLTGLRRDTPQVDEDEEKIDELDSAAYARRQLEQLSDSQQITADEAADLEVDESDPAAYARRQLEQLNDSQPLQATEALSETGPLTDDDVDAAAYAREQLAQLGGDASPAAPAQPIDPEREALAQKFLETEVQVRGLRTRYRNGELSRDQLQEELRALLILDDQDWWMMGVDSDSWYRYDNVSNAWVPDTPPRPAVTSSGTATETSGLNPVEVLGGRRLPFLDDNEVTSATGDLEYTDGFDIDGEPIRLPRSVPINDPDMTVAGRGGVYMDTVRRSEAETIQSTQLSDADVTMPHDSMADGGVYIPAPGTGSDTPPDYTIGASGESYEDAVEEQRRSTLQQILLVGSLLLGGLFILGTIFVIYVVISYNNIASEYRTQVAALANYEPQFQTARILDSAGQTIAELTSETGGDRVELTSLSQVSPEMIYAVVAVEDERYFENPGYDPVSILRAFVQNIGAGGVVSGASTITQQIASALILQDSSPTADNKLREIIIASEIAQNYSKSEILLLYLNEVFFGNQSYGIEAASQFYFQKPANELDLTEGAMLASLIAAPATRDPVTNRSAAFDATDNGLRQIAKVPCLNFTDVAGVGREFCVDDATILNTNNNFTGRTLVQRAEVQARDYLPREVDIEYPHFVYFVLAQLERDFGSAEIFRRGFVVQTTLNREIQETAQNALIQRIDGLQLTGVNTGAVMATDPNTGAIRAMVGSPDFNNADIDGQVNNTLTWQQPGSTIKPIMYTKALEGFDRNGNGVLEVGEYLTAASILWDVPTRYENPTYEPVNFDGRFRGPVAVRYALANSLNIPAVKTYDFIGPENFIEISRRMGLNFESDGRGEPPAVGRPSAVGATDVRLYDMMQAYGVLASTGNYMPLYTIESITDSAGNEILIPPRPAPARRVQPAIAFLLQNILSDDGARADTFGRNSILNIPQVPGRVAAKTGTTNDNRDLWTMGFSRNAVVGVWIGSADNGIIRNTGSVEAAAPIWNATMTTMLRELGVPPGFENPGNIAQQAICALTGTLAGSNCPSQRNELFVASQPPPPADQGPVVTIPVDTWTFQRANEICPNNVENRTYVNIGDSFAIPWLRSAAGQQTAQLLGLPQQIESPPSTACDLNTVLPTASITSPSDTQVISGVIQITGAAAAPNFARYQLEYAPLGTSNYTPITGAITIQQPNSGAVLGDWDTRTVPNGDYELRLSMFATAESGAGYLYRNVRVRIQNIPPTPTPTPTQPTATPQPLPTDTTIPLFPSNTPSNIFFPTDTPSFGILPIDPIVTQPAQSLNGATPTATISIGG